MGTVYGIDANILIFLGNNMPIDVYPGVWEQLEELIADGRALMPRDVYDELTMVDDSCAEWAKARQGFIEEPGDRHVSLVRDITDSYPGWVRGRKNAGDPWLIAHADIGGYTIVTNEGRRGRGVENQNLGVPNVADAFEVPCLKFTELAREEGWRFVRPS